MSWNTESVDDDIDLLRGLVQEDAELRAEFESSRAGFLGRGRGADDGTAESAMAARRHLEWFLFERPSARLRRIPIEVLEERWAERAPAEERDAIRSYRHSLASIFEVTGVEPGQGLWLRDLAGIGEYPVTDARASVSIEEGDLIIGRIFPLENSAYHISRAAGVFRNPELLIALRRDLERAREGRRGVLRIAQDELESMFWSPRVPAAAGEADPVAGARQLLLDGGVEDAEAAAILDELRRVPFSPGQLVPGSGDVLGEILDRLAFDTAVDLGAAREALIQAWLVLSGKANGAAAPAPAPQEPIDAARALADFDRGRARGASLDDLFATLEHDLDIDAGAEAEELSAVPDFPGVVGAMIEEFLWQSERESGRPPSEDREALRDLGLFTKDIGVFENLRAHDLALFACYWLPESALEDADQARRSIGALHRFCRWAEAEHELPLLSDFGSRLEGLRSSLPRIAEANRRRTREADRARGEILECVEVGTATTSRVRDREGREHEVRLDPMLATWLKPGDRLRAARSDDGRVAVYCCYPPEFASLERR